ncbi:hypothetical protein BDC45DRAFT_48631 [Circinella umbellata]|nr:hypothetical protein BDC45DRAFT_48631 [Circinella umbellata]
MKRILDSSGKQSKISFDIQLDQQKYYLRGDVIEGHIFLQSPKPIRVKNIRLQWSGRVRVQLEPTLRDERELFKETTYMELPETESATETARREAVKKAAMTVTGLFLVPSSTSKLAHFVEADKLYSYPFSFIIPENTILPSCTESEINVGGIVEYIIEAYLERPVSDFSSSIKAQIRVPVLQRIDTSRPEQIVPQSVQVECRGSPWLRGEGRENDGMAMITATVPKKAFIRNQPVPITVDINHFEPFKRKQALTIALVCILHSSRLDHTQCQGRH